MDRLVGVNEQRLRVGDIGEIELVQSRVERDQFRADVMTAESDVQSADFAMAQFLGERCAAAGRLPVPSGTLDAATRTFDVEQLVTQAVANRPDAIARARSVQAADAKIALARASLVPDVAVGGAYQRTGLGTGDFAQPPDSMLGAAISVNLPFSRRRAGGDVEAARVARVDADLASRNARVQIETGRTERLRAVSDRRAPPRRVSRRRAARREPGPGGAPLRLRARQRHAAGNDRRAAQGR